MPFYGANTGPLPPQTGGMVDPGSGFVPPLRDRFPNSVWHPASGADPNNVGGYTNCRLGTIAVPERLAVESFVFLLCRVKAHSWVLPWVGYIQVTGTASLNSILILSTFVCRSAE